MDSIGAEVGQKMRSAIKAKLMELNCYVDDELPDYIMVMVANKRSKSQMNLDLQLFLASKTETFVDWLHIVLKKLKEVTVTNPEVYKKVAEKRKYDETEKSDIRVKKEKKGKVKQRKLRNKDVVKVEKSLTDDLPITATALAEKRKVVIMRENQAGSVNEDNFDIPPLSAVQMSTTESELADIERQIKTVKSRLGLIIESDSDDGDFINLKAEPDELFSTEAPQVISEEGKLKGSTRRIQVVPPQAQQRHSFSQQKRGEHARITFGTEEGAPAINRKKSVLERLGKRPSDSAVSETENFLKRTKISSDTHKNEGGRSSALSRLGVQSKVLIPEKLPEEESAPPPPPLPPKDVPSVIKVKPRVIPPGTKQANKNLLLKAVAEAQRSVTQTPSIGNKFRPDALFTKKYKEKLEEERKASLETQKAVQNIVVQVRHGGDAARENEKENLEYLSKAVKDRLVAGLSGEPTSQKFIITLNGLEEKPRKPSPIIFDKVSASAKGKADVPDHLPLVRPPPSIKNKERCKYWPSCRQGAKCEFLHPTTLCKMFPQCKFRDKCLYIHPSCKFETSCTRKDCPYSHGLGIAAKVIASAVQTATCKFFPNCTKTNCTFYHPKLCKFGRFCKNKNECLFSHVTKGNFTWRSGV